MRAGSRRRRPTSSDGVPHQRELFDRRQDGGPSQRLQSFVAEAAAIDDQIPDPEGRRGRQFPRRLNPEADVAGVQPTQARQRRIRRDGSHPFRPKRVLEDEEVLQSGQLGSTEEGSATGPVMPLRASRRQRNRPPAGDSGPIERREGIGVRRV